MFTLPELPYDYSALEPHVDTETMHIHHDKHHAAYVKNLNDALAGHEDLLKMDINDLLSDLSKIPEEIRVKVKNNGGGHANHSLFWEIMGPGADGEPSGKLMEEIKKSFGDFPTFKEKFSAAGLGRFGSGWAWLIVDKEKLAIIDTGNQDSPVSEGKKPILLLDVWEHAYYLKYRNMRADYINGWWNVVNWKKVEKLFEKAGDK
jgi:Fe-Mn family superoxide dismutase